MARNPTCRCSPDVWTGFKSNLTGEGTGAEQVRQQVGTGGQQVRKKVPARAVAEPPTARGRVLSVADDEKEPMYCSGFCGVLNRDDLQIIMSSTRGDVAIVWTSNISCIVKFQPSRDCAEQTTNKWKS